MSHRSRNRVGTLFIVAGIFTLAASAPATPIYQHTFTSSGSTATLTGTSPTVDNYNGGGNSWSGNANGYFQADGDFTISNSSGAWLPFNPVAGEVYTFSTRITHTANAANVWYSFGFSQNNTDNNMAATGGYAWARVAPNSTTANQPYYAYTGANLAGSVYSGSIVPPLAANDFDIVLDLSGGNETTATVAFFVNGTQYGSTTAMNTANISYVGFSMAGTSSVSGSINSFSLSDNNAVPEPHTLALFGLALGLLAVVRRQVGLGRCSS